MHINSMVSCMNLDEYNNKTGFTNCRKLAMNIEGVYPASASMCVPGTCKVVYTLHMFP
jgi:hypothetical protein